MEPDASAPRVPRRAPPGAHAHLPERRATLAAAPSAAVPTDIRLSVRSWPSRLHSSIDTAYRARTVHVRRQCYLNSLPTRPVWDIRVLSWAR